MDSMLKPLKSIVSTSHSDAGVSPAPPSLLAFESREDYAELDEKKEGRTYELPI
jgi:hypothetical protein